jgi:hypothetical protein
MKRHALAAAMIAACSLLVTACSSAGDASGSGGVTAGALSGDDPKAGGTVDGDPNSGGGGKPDPGGCGKPPTACFTIDAGALCMDPNAKLLAEKLCFSKGLEVAGLSADPKAGCSVTCCDPGPPPPVEACTWTAIGDGSACLSFVDIKTKAVAICEAQGSEVRSVYPAGDCPGGATIAKLECCAPSANEPPGKDPGPPPPPKK